MFDGAVASSAPVAAFGEALAGGFYDVVAADFAACAPGIQAAFREVVALSATPEGCAQLTSKLATCEPVSAENVSVLVAYLQMLFGTFAELDYPYPVSFFNSSLPANPVNLSCARFAQTLAATGGDRVQALAASVALTPAPPGSPPVCLPFSASGPYPEALMPGLMPGAWSYQRCTEIVLPSAVADTNAMFLPCSEYEPNCWNVTRFAAFCADTFGVTVRPGFAAAFYSDLTEASAPTLTNVLWTNGGLDPWSYGGHYTNDTGRAVVALQMPGAAHHLDLRLPSASDPAAVVAARAFMTSFVGALLPKDSRKETPLMAKPQN